MIKSDSRTTVEKRCTKEERIAWVVGVTVAIAAMLSLIGMCIFRDDTEFMHDREGLDALRTLFNVGITVGVSGTGFVVASAALFLSATDAHKTLRSWGRVGVQRVIRLWSGALYSALATLCVSLVFQLAISAFDFVLGDDYSVYFFALAVAFTCLSGILAVHVAYIAFLGKLLLALVKHQVGNASKAPHTRQNP